jgi:putative ABC transport system permease protein
MKTIRQNVRFTLRLLWKNPGFTLVAIITLALGIVSNTAIFSVLYASLLAPMPYPDADRLVMVWSKIDGRNVVPQGTSSSGSGRIRLFGSSGLEWRELQPGYSRAAGNGFRSNRQSRLLPHAGPGFFLGRDFIPEEGSPGKDHVVILTHKTWERLGSDQTLSANNFA